MRPQHRHTVTPNGKQVSRAVSRTPGVRIVSVRRNVSQVIFFQTLQIAATIEQIRAAVAIWPCEMRPCSLGASWSRGARHGRGILKNVVCRGYSSLFRRSPQQQDLRGCTEITSADSRRECTVACVACHCATRRFARERMRSLC